MKTLIAALLVTLACPLTALAAEKIDPKLATAVQEARSRGAQMFSYDQAAWHASDQL